ncbi:hypothetical protein ACQVVB_14510 [Bacillus paranthracis]|uniref:hypothetical protein n=1 Tax=Bacillus paranthracis TaxID=2026186 RepID=UPI003D65FECD
MRYFISLFCSNRQCKNRSVTRVLEAISSSAAKEAIYNLNNNGKRETCPYCQKKLNYYLDFQPEDYVTQNEQSLLS